MTDRINRQYSANRGSMEGIENLGECRWWGNWEIFGSWGSWVKYGGNMEGVGKCIGVWGEGREGVLGVWEVCWGVGKYGVVWGMGVGVWKCVWGVAKCVWDVGKGVERVLGWGQKGGGARKCGKKYGTIWESGKIWGEGQCHDFGPQLS